MFRPSLIACLAAVALSAGAAGAAPRMVYTRHVLQIDTSGLDLSRDADRHVLQARIADAADQVCGGRPDRGNRYSGDELKLLMPAYDKCHADAMRSAQTSARVPAVAELNPARGQ